MIFFLSCFSSLLMRDDLVEQHLWADADRFWTKQFTYKYICETLDSPYKYHTPRGEYLYALYREMIDLALGPNSKHILSSFNSHFMCSVMNALWNIVHCIVVSERKNSIFTCIMLQRLFYRLKVVLSTLYTKFKKKGTDDITFGTPLVYINRKLTLEYLKSSRL